MKKLFFTLLFVATSLFAQLTNKYPTQELIDSKIPIVDIRTQPEWVETGILKGAIPIMFFNEQGNYNVQAFLEELNAKVNTKKQFAIICRTGHRTGIVSDFLSKEMKYKIINLKGGMVYAKEKNLSIVSYK